MLDNIQLRYALDPWQVLTPEQNFTFFVPIGNHYPYNVIKTREENVCNSKIVQLCFIKTWSFWIMCTSTVNFNGFVCSLVSILILDEAWDKVPMALTTRMNDGNHWDALQYVYKRHIIQGQALMYTDLRERTYVSHNQPRIVQIVSGDDERRKGGG